MTEASEREEAASHYEAGGFGRLAERLRAEAAASDVGGAASPACTRARHRDGAGPVVACGSGLVVLGLLGRSDSVSESVPASASL